MQEKTDQNAGNQPLVYDRLLVIVGAGYVDLDLLRHLHAGGGAIVAADGGAELCMQAGIVPEVIIGDMDSLADQELWEKRTSLIEIKEQESIDFEKCLHATKAKITVVLGVLGKRLDHSLAALEVMARYGGARHIILVDETDLALAVRGNFSFLVAEGARVSIHPLGNVVFAGSRGLEFTLTGIEMAPGIRSGTSNRAVTGIFDIVPQENQAVYLVILAKEYLQSLIESLKPTNRK